MEISTVAELISTVGFPIACCCGLGWMLYRERIAHEAESKEMISAIGELKNAITILIERIGNNDSK